MSKMFFLVAAYMLIWIALFGYVWNLIKKQNKLSRQVELLKADIEESR